MKVSKAIKVILSVLLAVALLYLAFRKVEWQVFWQDLRSTKWGYMVLSMLAAVAALALRSERWHSMLTPLDPEIKRIRVWDGSNYGNLASVVMPGVGEFIRCGAVCTKKATYDKILRPVEDTLHLSLWWLLVIAAVIVVAFIVITFKLRDKSRFLGKLAGWLSGMWVGIKSFKDIRHKGLFLLYTAGIWVMYILINFFAFKAIPAIEHLNFVDALFVSAAGNVASVVPTPLGMGAFHYLVALTLSVPFGSTWEVGILFATLTHESRAILLIITGLLSMLHGASVKNKE